MTEKQKEYYEKNKEKILLKQKAYKEKNKEKILKDKKKYREENKDKIKDYAKTYLKNKRKTDPFFKLKENLKNNIRKKLKSSGFKKLSKTEQILGCSYEEFKAYLESLWEPWMNWENRGLYNGTLNYGWDIDHITPTSSANNEIELVKLFHYTNLQPLCGYTNRHIKKDSF
jgi:hypothetical protein